MGTKLIKKLYLLFFLLLIIGCTNGSKQEPKALKGSINLENWDFKKKGSIQLKGEWSFWWKKLIDPNQFATKQFPEGNKFYQMPGIWNGRPDPHNPSKQLNGIGFATFALKLKLNKDYKNLGITLMGLEEVATARALYVLWGPENHKKIKTLLSAGKVASSSDEAIPQYKIELGELPKDIGSDALLVLHVSNFHRIKGGPWAPLKIGLYEGFKNENLFNLIVNGALLGILIIMGFYHLILFSQRREDKASLYFALLLFDAAVRQFTTNRIYQIFSPELSYFNWEWLFRFELISIYLGIIFFNGFTNALFFKTWFKKFLNASIYLIFFGSLVTLLSPALFYEKLLVFFQIYLLLTVTLNIIVCGIFAREGDITAKAVLLGTLPLILSVVHDIIYSQGIIQSFYLTPFGFIFFIIAQSTILARRFSNIFKHNSILLKEIQEKERERTAFFHNTSHELRTPLNGIIGFCDILLGNVLENKKREKVRKIKSLSLSLKDQVNGILDLAKYQKGKLTPEFSLMDCKSLVDELKVLAEGLKQKKKFIGFDIIMPSGLPLNFVSDPKMLIGILRNLLGNAFKFTENKEGNSILLSFNFKEEGLEIKIKDTGIGIDQEDLETIFKDFKQLQGDSRRKYEGTGLGLSIVKNYSETLGGSVKVESKLGEGSCFEVYLPKLDKELIKAVSSVPKKISLDFTDLDEVSENNIEINEKEIQENSKYKILVIDDNLVNLEVFEGILSSQGYQIDLCQGGKEGIDYLKEERPNLLILDLMMPDISGEDVLNWIRGNEEITDLPVILVTARASQEDKLFGLNLGADDYLAKPVNQEELKLKTKATISRLELAKMTQQLIEKEKMAKVGELLGELSHEIKNINVGLPTEKDELILVLQSLFSLIKIPTADWPEILNRMLYSEKSLKTLKELEIYKLLDSSPKELKNLRKFIHKIGDDKLAKKVWLDILNLPDSQSIPLSNLFLIYDLVHRFQLGSEKTLSLVKNVLDFSRPDSVSGKPITENLNRVIDNCLELFNKKIYYESIEVQLDVAKNQSVSFSQSDLSQVSLNFLGNAIDSLKKKNEDQNRRILIYQSEDEHFLSINFQDNGPGVPQEIQDKIFQRNFSTKGEKGSGLGLYICKKIVERNKAQLSLKSKPGETIFSINIPKN